MSFITRVKIDSAGDVTFPGLDFGSAEFTLIKHTKSTIVVKIGNHTYWRGVGLPRGQAETRFYVFRIIAGPDERGSYHVEEVTNFPARGPERTR